MNKINNKERKGNDPPKAVARPPGTYELPGTPGVSSNSCHALIQFVQ